MSLKSMKVLKKGLTIPNNPFESFIVNILLLYYNCSTDTLAVFNTIRARCSVVESIMMHAYHNVSLLWINSLSLLVGWTSLMTRWTNHHLMLKSYLYSSQTNYISNHKYMIQYSHKFIKILIFIQVKLSER